MQRFVDNVLGVAKESLKAFSQEAFSNVIKLVNGLSALILTFFPGKTNILEGIQGWELRPSLRAPRLPQWLENGVSSFNKLIHDYAAASNAETDSECESGLDDNGVPSPASSHSSHLPRASSFPYARGNGFSFKGGPISSAPDLLKNYFGISHRQQSSRSGKDLSTPSLRRSGSSGSLYRMYGLASKGITSVRDFAVHHKTDRRRGIVEDMQLIVELSIEKVFDVIRKVLMYCLSPLQTVKLFIGKLFTHEKAKESTKVQTATLGNANPAPSVKKEKYHPSMNTDARSCEDFIKDIGYPYEAIRVVTEDGYVLLLERISRPESQKVLYLQHGLLDSSLGWVSSGVVGSQAFAAHDQGYDVFLGNFRGLASQEHEDKNISSQRYWRYSINEHGTKDVPAMVEKIHEIKMRELNELHLISPVMATSVSEQPYTICGLAHSLGGAGLLMYVVTRQMENKPHRLARLVLLSPAGFHKDAPLLFELYQVLVLWLAPVAAIVMPGLYIKTWIFRGLFNKLARDFQNYPAVAGLVQTLCSFFVAGGDSSNWVEALGMTHYNVNDMPGVAYQVILHLAQMRHADRFQMYDYGSRDSNMRVYGTPEPLDIGKHYGLIDIPVDFVAGRKDKLIPRLNIRRHYELLKSSGGATSYAEFEYAHLDFTVAHKEDMVAYVMSKLRLSIDESTEPASMEGNGKSGRSRGEGKIVSRRLKTSRQVLERADGNNKLS